MAILTEGATQRWSGLYELGLWIAWHVAAFQRIKKLPSWESVRPTKTTKTAPTRRMTEGEMVDSMMAHAKQIHATATDPPRVVRRKIKG